MNDKLILKKLGPVEIQQYQQNRYPCFFVDGIDEVIPGKMARGFKCFSYNEWFFPGHFKDEPIVPGFIQVEMLAQVFLMTFLTFPENKGKKAGAISIDNARFKKKIEPGVRIDITAILDSYRRGVAKGSAIGYINEEEVCRINLTVAIPDIMMTYIPKK